MKKITEFDILNIGSGETYQLHDLLDIIIKLDGYKNAIVQYDASKPTMIPKRLIDISKAKRVLGFETNTSIEKGLKKTIDWFKSLN